MPRKHTALAVLVTVIWGVNFVVIDVGLDEFPPLLFAALRFTFVALPAVFFVPWPGVAVRYVAAVGLFLGVGQFAFLFVAMDLGMPAGLASLLLQAQAVFTVGFGALLLRERPGRWRVAGLTLAATGIAVIATGRSGRVELVPFVLMMASAASWGLGNIAARRAGARSGFQLIVWASLVPPVPLAALSMVLEGPDEAHSAFRTLSWPGVGALAYIVVLSTVVGFGVWNSLLRRYPADVVAPFSLLVPVTGMAAAWVFLDEVAGGREVAGAVVVLAGLLLVMRGRPAALGRAPASGSDGDPDDLVVVASGITAAVPVGRRDPE
jgi:O-acetylserine/cysteine efflux transporter